MVGQFKSGDYKSKARIDDVAKRATDILSDSSNLTLDCLQTMKGCYQRLIKDIGEDEAKKRMEVAITEALPRLKKTSADNEDLNRKVAKFFNGVASFEGDRHFVAPKVRRRDRKIDEFIMSLPDEKVDDFLTELQKSFAAKRKDIVQENSRLSGIWLDKNGMVFEEETNNASKVSIAAIDEFIERYKNIRRERAPGGEE